MHSIFAGQLYKHYKGGMYKIIGIAKHTETEEDLVVYIPLYQNEAQLWVRPMAMFVETVTVNGLTQPRFALQGEQ